MNRIAGHRTVTIFMPSQRARKTMSNDVRAKETAGNPGPRAAPWLIGGATPGVPQWTPLQRCALVLDVLRQRGNNYVERTKQAVPNVLSFEGEANPDGRRLQRPVNYGSGPHSTARRHRDGSPQAPVYRLSIPAPATGPASAA